MTRTKNIYLALLAVLLSPMAANADFIQISAESTNPGTNAGQWGDFTLIFNDLSNDGVFSWNELVSFSGISIGSQFRVALGVVPDVTGVSVFSIAPANAGAQLQAPGFWAFCFSEPCTAGVIIEGQGFEYTLSEVLLPEPGTLALLGLGLAGMGFTRRKKT